jgi:DNA polymerase-3 subunit epsilon
VLPIVRANTDEIALHEAFLDLLDKKSDGAVWRNLS